MPRLFKTKPCRGHGMLPPSALEVKDRSWKAHVCIEANEPLIATAG